MGCRGVGAIKGAGAPGTCPSHPRRPPVTPPSGTRAALTMYTDRLADGRASEPNTYPFPRATLNRIAASAGVVPSQLSLLEVSSGTPLFDAVLDYAGRTSQAPADNTTAPVRARWVNPRDSSEWVDGHGSDADDTDHTEAIAAAIKAHGLAEAPDDQGASQILARPHPRQLLKAVAGLGETVVTWPPPPALSVATLRASLLPGREGGREEAEGGGAAVALAADTSALPPTHTIHVVHFTAGPPLQGDCREPALFRTVVLVSAAPDGEAVLVEFARGVKTWRRDLYEQVPRPIESFGK